MKLSIIAIIQMQKFINKEFKIWNLLQSSLDVKRRALIVPKGDNDDDDAAAAADINRHSLYLYLSLSPTHFLLPLCIGEIWVVCVK